MIKIVRGNIFSSKSDCIVNTVNCVGFMGRGIALEMSIRYPEMERLYKERCKSGLMEIGSLWLYTPENNSQKVLNFPTKIDYKYPSKIEYLKSGLETFRREYHSYNIKSIAFPVLGAQNGRISANVALDLMKQYLSGLDDLNIEIYVFDSNNYKKDGLLLKFIDYINTSPDKKCVKLAEILSSRNDIFTFADITEKKIPEEQSDGSFKRRSIATKQFLQKTITAIRNEKPSDSDPQTSLFDDLKI